jgi:hypothetical protein
MTMPRGSKASTRSKQKRQAPKIEEGAKRRGYSSARAAETGWATVNKETGSAKKSGSGRGTKVARSSARRGGAKAHKSRRR